MFFYQVLKLNTELNTIQNCSAFHNTVQEDRSSTEKDSKDASKLKKQQNLEKIESLVVPDVCLRHFNHHQGGHNL